MNGRQPRLFVTDLDDTVLGGTRIYRRLSDSLCGFLDDLAANGCQWLMLTAWRAKHQLDLVLNSPVKSRPALVIDQLGRNAYRMVQDRLEPMAAYNDAMQQSMQACHRDGLIPFLRLALERWTPVDLYDDGGWLSFSVPQEEAQALHAMVEACRDMPLNFVFERENAVVALPNCLGKGLAMRFVQQELGVSGDKMAAAGDHALDIPMLRMVRWPLCPVNAAEAVRDEVRRLGGYVGRGMYAEGVMEAFRRIGAGE